MIIQEQGEGKNFLSGWFRDPSYVLRQATYTSIDEIEKKLMILDPLCASVVLLVDRRQISHSYTDVMTLKY